MTECPFRCGWVTDDRDELLAHLKMEHAGCGCGGGLVEAEEDGSLRCLACGKPKPTQDAA